MSPNQLATSVLCVLVAASLGGIVVFQRGRTRAYAFGVLLALAVMSVSSWTDFGRFQTIFVDRDAPDGEVRTRKVRQHRPFHFHEVVHYYLGPKYFRELGYLGLYDCVALAEREDADDNRREPWIRDYVRDLDDVLTDKPYSQALSDCTNRVRPRFSDARWASFKNDVHELGRLTGGGAWAAVVYDAGFNPPPSLIVLSSTLTNLIPLRWGTTPTYLLVTSIDLVLLILCAFVFQSSFGRIAGAVFAIYFGATFISHYSWNGGSVLRFTWFVEIVCALAALKRERWALAGALLGAATCDRIFPGAFAAGAMVPIAIHARRSPRHRQILKRFGIGYGATVAAMVLASLVVFDPAAWRTFFSRVTHHADIYYVMHIGLKKVLTFRSWVPSQNFGGHDGLIRFRNWNLALRETWSSMRPLVLLVQAAFAAGTFWAARKRRSWEAALLGGIVFMFVFNLPANYYYVVLSLVPALLLRGAATTPDPTRRLRDLGAYVSFSAFWMLTLIANRLSGDAIVYDYYICLALLGFLLLWIVAWLDPPKRLAAIR